MSDDSRLPVEFLKDRNPYSAELVEKLTPYVTFTRWPAGKSFTYTIEGKKYCYLIRSGEIMVFRGSDNLLMALMQAPAFIGASLMLSEEMNLHGTTTKETEVAILTIEEIYELISRENLWENLAKHAQITLNKLLVYTTNLTASNSYTILRGQLIELMKETEEFREGITAEKYIRNKTKLSRSGVMKMLSDLKIGQYIILEKGILKGINNLPEKY